MAVLPKVGIPSILNSRASNGQIPGMVAGEAIGGCDAVQTDPTTGLTMRATTRVDGFAPPEGAALGESFEMYNNNTAIRYGASSGGAGVGVLAGKLYYLDAGVPGGLNDTVNGGVCAYGCKGGVIVVKASF